MTPPLKTPSAATMAVRTAVILFLFVVPSGSSGEFQRNFAADFRENRRTERRSRNPWLTGVIDALREAGIQEGDTVSMYDLEFDFVN